MVLLYIIAGMLWTAFKWHVVICIGLVILHEVLIYALTPRIFRNGWIDTEKVKSIFTENSAESLMSDFEYYSYLFVPGINLLVISDIIYQATHKMEDENAEQ